MTEEKDQRLELMSKLRDEIHKRQLSNTENYDKAVLSLATAFLGFSLAFLKDFVSFTDASLNFLLPLSWGMFGLAVVATIASFFTSQRELSAQLSRAEDYYLNGDEGALERRTALDSWTERLNIASAISFVLGVAATILFISINLKEGTMSKHEDVKKGAGLPPIQRVPSGNQMGNDGALVPSVQKVPTPTPPAGGQTGGQPGTDSTQPGKK